MHRAVVVMSTGEGQRLQALAPSFLLLLCVLLYSSISAGNPVYD
jgi:hypothetical protein